ncbi:hypothetical protein [Reinekea marinisedimentorum]|uniref:Uncharacterized protein n=1 Tax=Reinekea marinisedimentorum TaxID=230495 RepID=A0A4R3I7R9_9GAMM|nr:hypothetical protein [Reinekea marinisedimentorum]TCS41335.1 hypothetical protein BCF53_10666 [Reinekea marinisedimentorum]
MTTGSWEPAAPSLPDKALLLKASKLIEPEQFSNEPVAELQPLQGQMQMNRSHWQETLASLETDELKALCRFFTLAEANWSDWFGGERNPVIWICKELKTRGAFPDKDLTSWIKANSENRFLPYGNVLG